MGWAAYLRLLAVHVERGQLVVHQLHPNGGQLLPLIQLVREALHVLHEHLGVPERKGDAGREGAREAGHSWECASPKRHSCTRLAARAESTHRGAPVSCDLEANHSFQQPRESVDFLYNSAAVM